MKRCVCACLLLLLFAPAALAQDVPLKLDGDIAVVKVDRVVVVQEDRTVVKRLPFTVQAPPSKGLYFWSYPPSVNATDRGDKLEVTAAPKGTLTISVKAVIPDLDKDGRFLGFRVQLGSVTFDVGDVTPPKPPDPKPPDPKPPEPKPPGPLAGLKVLIVEESAERPKLPPGQVSIILGKVMRDYLDGVCADDPDTGSKKGWRIVDKDQDLSALAKFYQDALAAARGKAMPRIVIGSDAGITYEGPLPATVAEAMALVGKYAPVKLRKAG